MLSPREFPSCLLASCLVANAACYIICSRQELELNYAKFFVGHNEKRCSKIVRDFSWVSPIMARFYLRLFHNYRSSEYVYCTLGSRCSRRSRATVKSRKVRGRRRKKTKERARKSSVRAAREGAEDEGEIKASGNDAQPTFHVEDMRRSLSTAGRGASRVQVLPRGDVSAHRAAIQTASSATTGTESPLPSSLTSSTLLPLHTEKSTTLDGTN